MKQMIFFEMMRRGLMAKCAVMRKYTFLSLFSINSYFETEPDIQSIIQPDVQDAAKKTLEMLLSILNLDLIRKDIEFSHIYKEILYASDGMLKYWYRTGNYDVTVFEALHKTGGVLSYGIPEFRLPKKLVQSEVDGVAALGVDFETNVVVGRSITIDELQEQGYQGIFVGSGAGLPRFQGIPGENLNGVYAANEFLTRVNLMKGYQFPDHPTPVKVTDTVCVIGAGNVAMDAARTAKRLGAKNVYIVYRRGPEEVPARAEEVHHAKEEGIIFKLLTNPVKIEGEDGWVKSMECVEMELGEPDASGRRRPIAKEGSNFTIETGTVIVAIGQSPNPLIRHTTPGLDCQSWGGIIVDEDSMKTSKDGVYAGGDVVTGAATVILAMGAGKKAAKAMDEYLQNK